MGDDLLDRFDMVGFLGDVTSPLEEGVEGLDKQHAILLCSHRSPIKNSCRNNLQSQG